MTGPTILLWNDDFGMVPDEVTEPTRRFRLLRDRRRLVEAGGVVFHVPTLDHDITRLPKRPGQRWVAHSMESAVNYPRLDDPAFMQTFDLTMTYRRDADVWVPYLPLDEFPQVGVDPTDDRRSHDGAAAIAYVASNPHTHSRRDEYVAELMRHIAVDSYGASLNNRSWDDDLGRSTKNATLARYPFTLALENSVAEDYVTEKFYDPLLMGSVPIYLGAPNVADFAPGSGCYIDVRDFDGPATLAAHLRDLLADAAAYRALHTWREAPLRAEYRTMRARVAEHPLDRLAARLRRD